jgi:hypothetical protein
LTRKTRWQLEEMSGVVVHAGVFGEEEREHSRVLFGGCGLEGGR